MQKFNTRIFRQFSLRTALMLMVLTACALLAWRSLALPYQRQRAALAALRSATSSALQVRTESRLLWLAKLFGQNRFQEVTALNIGDVDFEPAYLRHLLTFRGIHSLTISGEKFTAEDLQQLCSLSGLQSLTLDSTSVQPGDLQGLRKSPRLQIRLTQSRRIAEVRETLGEVNGEWEARHPSNIRWQPSFTGMFPATRSHWNSYEFVFLRYQFERFPGLFRMYQSDIADEDIDDVARTFRVMHHGPIDLRSLAPLHFLEDIDLRGTLLDKNALVPLGKMPLKQLQVGYDPNWDMEQLRGIGNLRQLEYLIIAACPFDDEGLSRIEPLQDLKLLWLPQTEIRGDGLKYVDATDLQSLDLSSTRISNATLAQLQRFQDLTELNLLGTSISDDGLKHLLHLKKLKVLVLNATKITNEGLATLSEMKNLERLSLADTRIDDKNLSQLSRLISLKWLDLRYTHTSEGAARRLSTSLPYHPVLSDSFISAVSGE